jgi:maltooligosyltrehalose trehalohydrolase
MTALFLLAPATPMLFQGQEFAASTPFHYFLDQQSKLANDVRQGRRHFLSQFRSLAPPDSQACLVDPTDPQTFARSKLDASERHSHAETLALHRDLLALRRGDPVFRGQSSGSYHLDGAVVGPEALIVRYFGVDGDDRLLLLNLGLDVWLEPAPEPLLAPPFGRRWEVLWSSEDPCYGGCGVAESETQHGWYLPGQAAVVMTSRILEDDPRGEHDPEPDHLEGERPRPA